ncbi:MAG: hypothetical protein JJ863_12250 [Deltaproteobacteria bacterium]|nr:hypothetical protein [Deltaproteobacteria bacterium]
MSLDWRERLETELREAGEGTIPDPADWVMDLDVEGRVALEVAVRDEATRLPTPLDERAFQPERRYLERVAGWCDWLGGGGSQRLEAAERVVWLRGGTPLPYLRVLAEVGDLIHALRLAEAFLERARPGDPQATEVRDFIRAEDVVPEGFDDAIRAALPDPDAVEAVLAETEPDDVVRLLWRMTTLAKESGLEGDELFAVATLGGASPQTLAMVENGEVSAGAVEAAAARFAGTRAEGLWYGLAARAACLAGDHLGTLRLLRVAVAKADPGLPPEMDLAFVWEHAGEELRTMLVQQQLAPPEAMR